ncbi:HD domain-containing protein [Methanolobus chelungpuianus]|uniref:Metal-dependent phosphohydrolase n=1 Tax=Methanolobus chelungpuianus TaxID=502115 RepID=A0AAE3H9P9_9EURY|nr:HD domain-containing protein [Methanolobus chelungpuianus]MCQ6962202.1 metal-dependent phosphohydrolase [Methanolobus chelungpuianus]
MIEEEFHLFEKWFTGYVSSFYSEDMFVLRNVKLKERHSLEVCRNASIISGPEGLDTEERYLAMIIGLFHDIGRFEQITRYRTFRDSESENHALLGVKILRSADVLARLPATLQDLICQAIANHNIYAIPETCDNRCLFHSRLVRDADKLDIFRVLADYYTERDSSPNPPLDMGLPDIPEYSSRLLGDLFNNRMASTADLRTCNDMRLARLSWVFDLNFKESFRLVRKHGYINMIISRLAQDDKVEDLRIHIEDYIDSVLASGSGIRG